MKIVPATYEQHEEVSTIAKLSPFTKGFANGGLRYVESYYEANWVLVAQERGKTLGFVCVRHCTRKPHTSVYYIGVADKRKGVGSALLAEVLSKSEWGRLELISEKENLDGLRFYWHVGFKVVGDGQNNAGVPYWRLRLERKDAKWQL